MTRVDEELLTRLRPLIFAIAYRMLGSVSEAEDIVQETSLRVFGALRDGVQIASPEAYARTVATRLAIDELRSARTRRERYVGEWLPEPLLDRPEDVDPPGRTELAESLSLALLVLLERLSPEQRAVFLLHDVFDYGYREIGEIIGRREDNVRQLAARARRHVEARRPRFATTSEQRAEVARRFFAAVQEGEVAALEALLAEDAALHGDGGGRVPALARSLRGRARIARTVLAWSRALTHAGGGLTPVAVNGGPGAVLRDGEGGLLGVWSIDIAEGQIHTVRSIINPDKLAHLGPPSALTRPAAAPPAPADVAF